MFARLLLAPLVILTLVGLYISWEVSSDYSWMIIIGVILIALVHVFSPQINWWWYSRHPKDLDAPIIQFLERFDLYYQQLAPMARIRFRQRMALLMMGNEYMPQGWESVPADVEAIIAAAAVKVRFHEENLLYANCEKIVVYPLAFPSPAYLHDWHSSEWFAEDGVVLFAADALMKGQLQPGKSIDLALYEYCRIQQELTGQGRPGGSVEDPWPEIRRRTGWGPEEIQAMIGLKDVDAGAVLRSLDFQPIFPR